MTYADRPLDENPLWNAEYHLRFAHDYMLTARVLDAARQPAEHYQRMAMQQMKDAAAALGYDLVARPAAAAEAPARATVVALPFAQVSQ